MSPSDCKNGYDQLRLKTSVWDGRRYWMHVRHDAAISIVAQRDGQPETEYITIPRRTFQAMLNWYLKDQEPSQ